MNKIRTQRLRWACRRGMLELELLLLPFFDSQFANLTEQQQINFEELLSQPDQLLYTWLIGTEIPEETKLAELIRMIRQHGQHSI